MGNKITKILVILLMITGLSGAGYLYYQKTVLDKEIISLNKIITDGERKQRALHKKYTQEKAKLGTCMRVKMAEESKNAKLLKQIKQVSEEKETLVTKMEGLEKKHQKKLESAQKRIEKLIVFKDKLLQFREKLTEKYRQLVLKNREKTEEIYELTSQKKNLESELRMTESSLKRSNTHNAKLSKIAEELTEKYREKAGNGEPFTKLKMVELEHMLQAYIKQIDKETIIKQ